MLRWTSHTGDPMLGYGTEDGALGKEYKILPEHIDTKEIYVDVSLSHYIPTDELQQINAATILIKEVGIAFVDAAKKLNIANPEELQARYEQEQLDKAELAIAIKKMNAKADLEIQLEQMKALQGMQGPPQAPPSPGGMNETSMSNARMADTTGFAQSRTGAPREEAQSIACVRVSSAS